MAVTSPTKGSTAPTITSPLLAWPSRPTPRSSPSTSPVDASRLPDNPYAYAMPVASGKGKERARAPEVRIVHPSISHNLSSMAGEGSDYARSHSTPTGDGEREDGDSRTVNYGPPRKPLTPHQLGRIAQSFGIAIPSLPLPSPTHSPISSSNHASSSRHPMSYSTSRSSTPYLLTVIPPFALLNLPSADNSSQDVKDRQKRWKRGKLLPLQPTIGSMLLSIAREYNLPSTSGIGLYLVHAPGTGIGSSNSSAASSSSFGGEEAVGPQITSQTWSSLFSTYLLNAASASSPNYSRSSTPAQTPMKSSGPLGKDLVNYPPSPLSLVDKLSKTSSSSSGPRTRLASASALPDARHSDDFQPIPPNPPFFPLHSKQSSTSSSGVPLTPTSSASAGAGMNGGMSSLIVGTIEFDVDPEEAGWLEDWKRAGPSKSGHRRKASSVSDSGTTSRHTGHGQRQLRLVRKVNNERQIRNIDFSPVLMSSPPSHSTFRSIDTEIATADSTLVDGDSQSSLDGHSSQQRPNIRKLSDAERRFQITDPSAGIVSVSPSFDHFPNPDISIDLQDDGDGDRSAREIQELLSMLSQSAKEEDVDRSMLGGERMLGDDLLASPIELDKGQLSRVVLAGVDKRGSSLVMAEELDDLERIMRQLSPREIRITSPRVLTPRMAAKVAAARVQAANLSLPSPSGKPKMASSPLATGFAAQQRHKLPSSTTIERPPRGDASKLDPTSHDDRELEKPAWPAVPFASPSSPTIDDIFKHAQPAQSSSGAISAETLKRMQASPPRQGAKEWRPIRPPRPQSPKLEHQRTLSHTLSPELTSQLRSTPGQQVPPGNGKESPMSPVNEDEVVEANGKPRLRGRAGSISVKGLKKQMSGKNLSLRWGSERDRQQSESQVPIPSSSNTVDRPDLAQRSVSETVGLFNSSLLDTTTDTSFASLREGNVARSTSLKQANKDQSGPESSLPSPPTSASSATFKSGFASRILGNSFSFGRKNSTSSSASKDASTGHGDKKTKGSSQRSASISSPIASTFHKVDSDAVSLPVPDGKVAPIGYLIEPDVNIPSTTALTTPRKTGRAGTGGIDDSPSPSSPKSVKRKPVPAPRLPPRPNGHTAAQGGMGRSESTGSVSRFVLEDPPRRKITMLGEEVK